MKSQNPTIEWVNKPGKRCLKFVFTETLTASDAEAAIAEWRETFQSSEDQSITLIWDCKKMHGYDSAARIKWTDALKEMKSRIDTIWLISGSSLIRMGASVIGLLSSLKIKTVDSENKITL
jgi:hypothetical protein